MGGEDSNAASYLRHQYGVADELLSVTLFSFGGGLEALGEDSAALWRSLKAHFSTDQDASIERLDLFGSNAGAVLVRSRTLEPGRQLLEATNSIRQQQILAFQPEPLRTWLGGKPAEGEQGQVVAVVLLKLRDDAMLQDSHLLPVAVAELCHTAIRKLRGGAVASEPWVAVGPADLLFVLRSDSIRAIGEALSILRGVTLGQLLSGSEPGGPFCEAFRESLTAVPNSALDDQLKRAGDRWPDGDAFIRELRLVSGTHTTLGVRHDSLAGTRRLCAAALGAANAECAEVGDLTVLGRVRLAARKLLAPDGLLDRAGEGEVPAGWRSEKVHARMVLRVRPGRDWGVKEIGRALLEGGFEAEGLAPELPRGVFGPLDVALLDPAIPLPFARVLGVLCLLEHLRFGAPVLKWRIRSLLQSTYTSFDEMSLEAGKQDPVTKAPLSQLDPLTEDELRQPEDGLRCWLHAGRSQVLDQYQVELPPWEQWRDRNDPPWLPRHVHRAARRLVQLFNSGLREQVTAVYLLDLLPSIRTLVEIIETGKMVSRAGSLDDWFSWQPLPWLHGGRSARVELQARRVVPHIVQAIRLLDLGLKQRMRASLADPSGDLSIDLVGRRHKWLSGVAALVPALQERILPAPDLFRWPGLVLLNTIERPLEVFIPDFAFVRVGPDILEQPEMLLTLFQEIGHLALRAREHRPAILQVREAVRAIVDGATTTQKRDGKFLNQTLEELYCDLTLAFLGFDGNLDEYARFVLRRLPNLAPRAHRSYRHQVWERLFIVFVLLDVEDRRSEDDTMRLAERRPERMERHLAHAGHRFRDLVGRVLDGRASSAGPESIDRWSVRQELQIEAGSQGDVDLGSGLWGRLLQTAADVLAVMTPTRLDMFRIGTRSVFDWLKNLSRRRREGQALHSHPPLPPRRPRIHNLHWEHPVTRLWPGVGQSRSEQSELLRSFSAPLLLPADLAPWLSDVRALLLADRDDVSDADRLVLLQTLWGASQGFRRLVALKTFSAASHGRTSNRHPPADDGGPAGLPLFPIFSLTPVEAEPEWTSREHG